MEVLKVSVLILAVMVQSVAFVVLSVVAWKLFANSNIREMQGVIGSMVRRINVLEGKVSKKEGGR